MVNIMENQSVALNSARVGASVSATPSVNEGAASARAKVNTSDVPSASSGNLAPAYVSPKGVVDPESGVFVLQYRDGETGDVEVQYPSQKAVSAYQGAAVVSEDQAKPSVSGGNAGAGHAGVDAPAVKSETVV